MQVAVCEKSFVPSLARTRILIIAIATVVFCLQASAATQPGPDAFGYTAGNTSAYAFTNITNSITAKRVLVLADDQALTVDLGFTFNFYGSNYTAVSISVNGLLSFGGINTNWINANLTGPITPDLPTIAVFWDDWETLSEQRPIFYDTIGPVGNRQFIVQWERLVAVDELTGFDPVTFQVRLFEGNNAILFSYADVVLSDDSTYGGGAHQTIGIRDRAGHLNNRNLQWSHDQQVLANGDDILFTRPNRPPIAVNDTVTTPEDQPLIISVLANDTDPDANFLTVTAVTQGTNGTVTLISSNNTVQYLPRLDYRGQDHFTYTISDGQGGIATAVVTVQVTDENDPPVARPDNGYRVNEDATLVVPAPGVLLNDTDQEGSTLSAVLVAGPGHGTVTLNPNGGFTYVPASNYFGADSFVYRASDGNLLSSNATVTITVDPMNDPPVALNTTGTTAEETPVTIRLRATDPDGDTVTFAVATPPAHGTVNGTLPDVVYRPATNFCGADSFTFVVLDSRGGSSIGTVFVTVTAVNDFGPVAVSDSVQARANTTNIIGNEVLLSNDTDPDGCDSLSITSVPARSARGGTLTLGSQTLSYTPPTNFVGLDSFAYVVGDGYGNTATGMVQVTVLPRLQITRLMPGSGQLSALSASSMVVAFEGAPGGRYNVEASANFVQWTVLGPGVESSPGKFEFRDTTAAQAPIRFYRVTGAGSTNSAVDDVLVASEDQSASLDVTSNDTSIDGFLLLVGVTQATNGQVTMGNGNAVTYTPSTNFNGADHFTYTVSDSLGRTISATVAVTVAPRNDAPVASTNGYQMVTNDVLVVSAPGVLANDSDIDGDAVSAVLVTPPAHGQLTLAPDGSFTYTPAPNYVGDDTFVYRASDGELSSIAVPVTIRVVVNERPVAEDIAVNTVEDRAVAVVLRGTDGNGDVLAFSILSDPAHGGLTGSAPNLSYRPATNFHGADVFTYVVNDGRGSSSTGRVAITIIPINEFTPVAADDTLQVVRNRSTVITNAMLLANDSDADLYDVLVVTGVSPSSTAGGVVAFGPQTITYAPPRGHIGPDTFNYFISDGLGRFATGTVHVTVSLRMHITGVTPTSSNTMVVTFEAPSGDTYVVEASPDLVQWTPVGVGIETSPGIFAVNDSVGSAAKRFYRITVDDNAAAAAAATGEGTPTNEVPAVSEPDPVPDDIEPDR